MDRVRTGRAAGSEYASQKTSSASPMASPAHRHARSGSAVGGAANFRRQQNTAARAAAQRLARVMAHQPADGRDGGSSSDDDDDDDDLEFAGPPIGLRTPRRSFQRAPPPLAVSPALGRYLAEQTSTVRYTSPGRSSSVAKPTTPIPPVRPLARPLASTSASESPTANQRENRMSIDLGNLKIQETGHTHSSAALEDEIDVLQEESEKVVEKLHLAEKRRKDAEMRAKQLKEQAALRAAAEVNVAKNDEIANLRLKSETSRNEAKSSALHLHRAETELKSLRLLAQRMTLTEEEMEEVVLKKCWLARYWKLCVHHGIHVEIAEKRHDYWSSMAPLPLEVVLSAGQKARDGLSSENADAEETDKISYDIHDLAGEDNIQSMVLVEKGMNELASLKVEDAVLFAMAQHRRPSLKPSSDNVLPVPVEGQSHVEPFELSQEESEDIRFKRAWLTYIWRRVKNHGLEEDIADERLRYWANQSTHPPTSHDAVDVVRGLWELKKLGIETQLWEASRKGLDQDSMDSRSQIEEP